MRKEFASWAVTTASRERGMIFLTGDLGFGALEQVQATMGDRFINVGVCEQNMISFAAGLAREGLWPVCYSIAPFAVFRPYEQIRLDVAIHRLSVKIVGNGGGYGYGIMGATHHALEDLATLSCLPNFGCFVPLCNSDVAGACHSFWKNQGPAYLRLGLADWPLALGTLPNFAGVRQLIAATSRERAVTVVGIGPVLLNISSWITGIRNADVFAISRLPLEGDTTELVASVNRNGMVLVIEEHARFGGLGSHLAMLLSEKGIPFKMSHSFAAGYPTGKYGSQKWHQRESKLDSESLYNAFTNLSGSKSLAPQNA